MEGKIALKVSNLDNVATIFASGVRDGDLVTIVDQAGNRKTVAVIGDIPYGHKIATRDIHAGEDINKYGEEIGVATHEIRMGEYVHIHNLDSKRGRGDWEEK